MSIKQIVIWALIVRLLIAPFLFHPDIKDINLRVSFLHTKRIFNIYDYLQRNPITKVNAPDFVYPPLTYFLLGSYQKIISPILGSDFQKWLFDFSGRSFENSKLYYYLLLLKLPYFFFDLLVVFILLKVVPPEQKKKAVFFWLFNPINLYAIYGIGQFDIIPSALVFSSWYLWKKHRISYASILFGLACALKTYPLLFLPFILFTEEKFLSRIKFLVISSTIYLLTIAPYLNSINFQQNVLFSGLTQRVLEQKINILSANIPIFIIFYLFLIFLKLKFRGTSIWVFITMTLLLVFSLIKVHPQWMIWVMPFITLAYGLKKINIAIFLLFSISYFISMVTIDDKYLTSAIFAPISSIFMDIPSISQTLTLTKINLIQNINRTLFAIISFIISYRIIQET